MVRPTKASQKTRLDWSLGWETLSGADSVERRQVESGSYLLENLEKNAQAVARIYTRLPSEGPTSYRGKLFQIRWWFHVTLDTSFWGRDPEREIRFEVVPRPLEALPETPEISVQAQSQTAPLLSVSRAKGGSEICPFCRDSVGSDDPPCPRCSTSHHAECLELYGGCTIPGCT